MVPLEKTAISRDDVFFKIEGTLLGPLTLEDTRGAILVLPLLSSHQG
jgi:hypothetical protein